MITNVLQTFLMVYSVCVCLLTSRDLSMTYGRIFQAILTKFSKNLWCQKRKKWLVWCRNPKMPSPTLTQKTSEIGNSQPNIICKITCEWKHINQWLKTRSQTKYVLEVIQTRDPGHVPFTRGYVTYFLNFGTPSVTFKRKKPGSFFSLLDKPWRVLHNGRWMINNPKVGVARVTWLTF